MELYDELIARGLIAQVTDEEEIKELVNTGKATFYIGFDPTADSLHVGHFMALCLMKRLQMAGNKPIALIGGGTAMVGDPSGRTDMRQMMTVETINHNVECFRKQIGKFIDFSDGKALLVNNAEWLLDLNYMDMLRETAGIAAIVCIYSQLSCARLIERMRVIEVRIHKIALILRGIVAQHPRVQFLSRSTPCPIVGNGASVTRIRTAVTEPQCRGCCRKGSAWRSGRTARPPIAGWTW